MRRVFITGATGFIGSHVTELFANSGWYVLALTPYGTGHIDHLKGVGNVDFLDADLGKAPKIKRELESFKPDMCIHMAWYTNPKDYAHSKINLECLSGTLDLLESLKAVDCTRLIMAGTCFEYDTTLETLYEDSPCKPQSLYAASKYSAYLLAEQIAKTNNWSFQYPRIFYTYGPRSPLTKFPNNVIVSLLQGKKFDITFPSYFRDYVYVGDIARAFLTIARKEKIQGVINVGTGTAIPMFSMIDQIARQIDRKDLVDLSQFLEYDYTQPAIIKANNYRLSVEGGWEPATELVAGIANSISWVKEKLQEEAEDEAECQRLRRGL